MGHQPEEHALPLVGAPLEGSDGLVERVEDGWHLGAQQGEVVGRLLLDAEERMHQPQLDAARVQLVAEGQERGQPGGVDGGGSRRVGNEQLDGRIVGQGADGR